jgi:hypothetical protein
MSALRISGLPLVRARDRRVWRACTSRRHEQHLKRCAGVVQRYKRRPLDLAVRGEAVAVAAHALTPSTHTLKALPMLFVEQQRASVLIERQ